MKNKITINCHSSIKITDNKIIYFDPYKIKDNYKDADIIFITHDHYDHFDVDSINKIIKNNTILVIPDKMNVENLLEINSKNMVKVLPNNTYDIRGYKIETIPSYNINKNFHPKENNWVGYIITINNERIYVAGDTDITSENKKVKCDIALVPIGGKFTMNYNEAAELINLIKPKTVIPTHYAEIIGSKIDGENFKKLISNDIECILLIK